MVQGGDWRPSVLGPVSGVHMDILSGRDCEIGWEDVYAENPVLEDGAVGGGVHEEVEMRVGMGRW